VLPEEIDEGSNFRRQMVTMRIDGIHRKFHRPLFGQQANQTARLEIVVDRESRRQTVKAKAAVA